MSKVNVYLKQEYGSKNLSVDIKEIIYFSAVKLAELFVVNKCGEAFLSFTNKPYKTE